MADWSAGGGKGGGGGVAEEKRRRGVRRVRGSLGGLEGKWGKAVRSRSSSHLSE